MVTVPSLTSDRTKGELLSSWMRVKVSDSSHSFSGICTVLRISWRVECRWISFCDCVRGSRILTLEVIVMAAS